MSSDGDGSSVMTISGVTAGSSEGAATALGETWRVRTQFDNAVREVRARSEEAKQKVARGIFNSCMKKVGGNFSGAVLAMRDACRSANKSGYGKEHQLHSNEDRSIQKMADYSVAFLEALGALQLLREVGVVRPEDAILLCQATMWHHRDHFISIGWKNGLPLDWIDNIANIDDEHSPLREAFLGAADIMLESAGISGMSITPTPFAYTDADVAFSRRANAIWSDDQPYHRFLEVARGLQDGDFKYSRFEFDAMQPLLGITVVDSKKTE